MNMMSEGVGSDSLKSSFEELLELGVTVSVSSEDSFVDSSTEEFVGLGDVSFEFLAFLFPQAVRRQRHVVRNTNLRHIFFFMLNLLPCIYNKIQNMLKTLYHTMMVV